MAAPKFVPLAPRPIERYEAILDAAAYARIQRIAERARRQFAGMAIWHVSSTARGGGVAEMLHSLLAYVRGVGVDTRWVVLREAEGFFLVTKRLHNHLHGDPGDGGDLGQAEHDLYESTLAATAARLAEQIQPGDVVWLHDPQTAGLAPAVSRLGAKVIWRCHIGVDEPNDLVRHAWDFLRSDLELVDAFVFSRRAYIWDGLNTERVWLMPPSIDPFSPKNQELTPAVVEAILQTIELLEGSPETAPLFTRGDGTPGRVERPAEILQENPLPSKGRVVMQVSRWDRLKDPCGLLECFERHIDDPAARLVLVGPASGAVADDPEGAAVQREVLEAWRRLPDAVRCRVHVVSLPMFDLEENGAMVNALQRRADVLVQKSLAEGFGLTVAEGMWKERPVVGSRVGGIQDQIVDWESGVLVDDPRDLAAFAGAITALLDDPELASRLGRAAKQRVMDRFLGIGRLTEYVELVTSVTGITERRRQGL